MSILPQLEENRGTISSALGKSLARKVLEGDTDILPEAAALLGHDSKDVRAGAAKILEQTAVVDPSLVLQFLPRLLTALDTPERQTRWMAIHTLGLCATLDALPKAQAFLAADSGACLWGAAIRYLGDIGAVSKSNANAVFPILEEALQRIPRQTKNVLDSFLRILARTDGEARNRIACYGEMYAQDDKSSIRAVSRKINRRTVRS